MGTNENLKKHISEIFSTLQLTIPFEVYCFDDDTMPKWAEQTQFSHEYLVCCPNNADRQRLQTFIGKSIFESENYLFWFEGNRIQAMEENETEIQNIVTDPSEESKQKVDYLKSETRLPAWLDNYIFKSLGAEYAPDFQRFDFNLDLTSDETLKYLGTYFPRSYAESFCIFDNIFQNKIYHQIVSQKNSFNILSVGCGTGGDLIGLLTVIEKYCSAESSVNIWAIDGNEEAVAILKKIIGEFRAKTDKKIKLNVDVYTFASISDYDLSQHTEKYDFILSFKMICEIIAAGKGANDSSYYDFVMKFLPLLSDHGLCVLLDVTTKTEHATFNPILMNRQVNQALRELKNYRTLLPLSCNLYEGQCMIDCFCQKVFTVTHYRHSSDKSKVAYRVITTKLLCDIIGKPILEIQYEIQSNNEGKCLHSNKYKYKPILDSYNLIS